MGAHPLVQQLTPLRSLIQRRWRPSWACPTCRPKLQGRRYLGTELVTDNSKPFYVTTPIFYVNAAPHVGHMYTMILADVMKRWQVLKGRRAILCTGVDEHGLKIQQAAQKAETPPQAFCDKGAEVFQQLAERCNISNDYFVRTTAGSHKDAVQYAWSLLQARGYIYSSKHEGWYAVSDEAFYPTSQVHQILDPATGRKLLVSKETGNEVQWSSEVNYRFRLSAFRDKLLEFYKANPTWITPAYRMDTVVAAVEEGLEDLSISRPRDRLDWAIRVPDDSSQSIYVWLDALLNYASIAGYPWAPNRKDQHFWPADIHVIGKDIVRFHCIYWPAFLMALDLPLPKKIMTHAHWTMDDRKMSKSIGNVVNPFWAIDRFDVETLRYFLVHHGGIENDANYDNAFIVGRYKNDLQDKLGNLAARVLQSKIYDPKKVRERYGGNLSTLEEDCEQCIKDSPPSPPSTSQQFDDKKMANRDMVKYREMLAALPQTIDSHFDNMAPNKALHALMTTIFAANAFVQNHEPWLLVKSLKNNQEMGSGKRASLERRLDCVLFLAIETLRIVGIMLQPFMPGKAKELLDMLLVEEGNRGYEHTKLCSDSTYGGKRADKSEVLFLPLVNTM